jgi:competence protein ComEC
MRRQRNWLTYLLAGLFFFVVALLGGGSGPLADSDDRLRVAMFDVGQGDATLITTPHKETILIDGGPDSSILSRLGSSLPFSTHEIDLVIATHNHADHITGLNRVIERYDVNRMWISGAVHTTNEYLKMLEQIKAKKIPTDIVYNGTEATLTSTQELQPEDQHDATVVVKVEYGQTSFMLTGDIDEDHERAIMASSQNLKSDVLKVAHHGSKTGTSVSFLEAVAPAYAVIQVGKGNTYGHPAPSTIERLKSYGAMVLRTDEQGTILFASDGQKVELLQPKR